MRMLLLNLALLMVVGRCLCGKLHPQKNQPHISTMMANEKPYQGEVIQVQCLVKSTNFEDLVVEFRRSIANQSKPVEVLSSNNEILIVEPRGQRYQVDIEESSNNANIYVLKIFNINIQNDSGVYKCLVKHKGQVLDKRETLIMVKDPYEDEDYDFANPWTDDNPGPTSSIWRNYKTEHPEENVKTKTKTFSSKCGTLVEYEGHEGMKIPPVVCYPKTRSKGELHLHQELAETATLSCVAEGLPPPKVEWFKQKTTTGADQIQHEEIQQIHTNNRVSIFSDEFGDSFMTVSLVIDTVTEDDYGTYVCTATNKHGDKDSMKIILDKMLPSSASSFWTKTSLSSYFALMTSFTILLLVYSS